MEINGIKVDVARGFDAMRGGQVLEHFDNYAQAERYMKAHFGVTIRYWLAQ